MGFPSTMVIDTTQESLAATKGLPMKGWKSKIEIDRLYKINLIDGGLKNTAKCLEIYK